MGRLFVTGAFVFAGLLLLGSALAAWRYREAPAANRFVVVCCVAGIGVLTIGTGVALNLHTIILASTVIVAILLPIPWVLFVFEYTGRTKFISPGITGIIATVPFIGFVATAVIFGSRWVLWMSLPSLATASGLIGVGVAFLSIVQWLALLYAGGLMFVGSGLLLWTFHRYEHLDSIVGMLLGGFGIIPWLSLLLGLQVDRTGSLAMPETIAAGFLIGGFTVAGVLDRYHLFQTIPAAGNIGPATVIEEMEDLVLVTDSEGTIVEINDAVKSKLNMRRPGVVGADVTELLDASISDLLESSTVELQSVTGHRLFDPTVTELTDQHGINIGYTLVLRDVTDRVTRQQRLKVLNRVLRHNLRNDMTTIVGHAEWLRKGANDPRLVETAETIVRNGEELAALAEEAREIDRLMASPGKPTQDVSLAALIQNVTTDAESDHPQVTCQHHVPEDVVVTLRDDLLKRALTNLVENAIEHNDSEEPRVELRAIYEPDRTYPLTVSVVDNGPGIPEAEQKAVLEGDETPLQHGSGLGLWVVRWIVTRLGGEMDIEHREPRGTIVSLQVPLEHESEAGTMATPVRPRG